MTLNLCEAFKKIDDDWTNNILFENNHIGGQINEKYCHTDSETWNEKCKTTGETVRNATVSLLNNLFTGDKYIESENENNEYITYIMLWLSNKMKLIKTENYGSVAEFYAAFIRDNKEYKAYITQIDKNQKIMNLKIDRTRKLYALLNDLCNAIIIYNKDSSSCRNISNCPNFLNFVDNWEKQSKQLLEKKTKVFEDEDYCDVLLTLKNSYEKFKKDNKMQKKLPEFEEIEELHDCKKFHKEAKNSLKVKVLMPQYVSRYINIVKIGFKKYNSFFGNMFTNNVNYLYEQAFPTLKNVRCKFINFADTTIGHMNDQLKKAIEAYVLDNCKPEKKGPDGESPPPSSSDEPNKTQQSSLDPSEGGSDQKDQEGSKKTVPSRLVKREIPVYKVTGNETTEISDNSLNVYKKIGISILILLIPIALTIMYKYLPFGWRKKSKKKKKMKKAINMFGTNEMTENVINPTDRKKQMQIIINLSTQNKQGKKFINSSTPKKQDKQFINLSTQNKQDKKFINSSTPKKQDKKFINSSTPKKQDKQFINSSTPKKQDKQFISSSTQKKQDKKFIDLSTQKKQGKKLTNSYTQKKQTKHFINSIYWEKYPLLNIYKLMKADPVPFIILFLLFIFYVYKRKDDSLE
ncbi:PIR protein [Plasmodium yoelii]|uniref:PIR protein n=3 Tax=Plasmodium yoelii TaxID=5861 RepID=A0AAE9WJ86_PLAYO|nr:PIR protein [Plasmodium yoelii]WBY54595.1 PIR protein [Plasmodium yoelii yoelii]CDU15994.1 YIR protein [Plasmodium yoelii]VTZ71589.1 PIR protein [Plasmodium yoelii]|eukprot:XP_022811292.1 PIR protein [Plasmodium yoelii]